MPLATGVRPGAPVALPKTNRAKDKRMAKTLTAAMGFTRRVFVPVESFVASVDGTDAGFVQNQTRVREGHRILDMFPHLFEEIRVDYDVEAATAAPGETR